MTEVSASAAEVAGVLAHAMVARSPDPEAAEAGLRRFVGAAGSGVGAALARDASLLEALLAILGNSEFLTEALVQAPELLLWLDTARRENRGRAREEWARELAEFTRGLAAGERTAGLARFKRREYLRIVLRDLQGLASLAETTQELSHLADAMLEQAFAWSWNDLAGRFGTPRQGGEGAELAVLGLGKLGGEELNYSSDIDLLFLYSGAGETAGGAETTTNREFFTRMAQAITGYVSSVSSEGVAYRVDLRLRPGGREGDVALSLDQAAGYYRGQARDWELQMLIRARWCAGSRKLARQFLGMVEPGVYPERPRAEAVAEGVRLSRQRISAQLEHHRAIRRRGPGLDVKLDPGGIRDIEFLAQYLQRLHGGAEAWVRGGNTLVALQRLHDNRWLGPGEYQRLSSAYWLLRQVEHRLQLRLGQQTHALPAAPARLAWLARSLALAEGGRLAAAVGPWLSAAAARSAAAGELAAELEAELQRRMGGVREIYLRYLGEGVGLAPAAPAAAAAPAGELLAQVRQQVAQGRHGRRQLERLLRSAPTQPEEEAVLAGLSDTAQARLAVALEQSDAMAEMLIRRPGLAAMLEPGAAAELVAGGEWSVASGQLRRWRQQRTLQLLWEEWDAAAPAGATLAAHTGVAEAILVRALELAGAVSPAAPSLAVVGMGRLGLGELDLQSDLDLVFVSDEEDREAAARLAAKLIELLSAYTGEGSLYAVDTRLRPGGGEGELVQTPASLAAYFGRQAGAWEAFSYLKARVVAGSAGCGGRCLEMVRARLRERFRAGGIDAEEVAGLRERMRQAGRPGRWGLKTPAGGYYDVDFIVSRRLLEAGITAWGEGGLAGGALRLGAEGLAPAEVAARLASHAAFLRAADHALRAATGRAAQQAPASGEAVERAAAWLRRTQPGAPELEAGVDEACRGIREIYREWR